MPLHAGRLVDALTAGQSAGPASLEGFVMMTGRGLVVVVLHHLAWWRVVPLTLGIMSDVVRKRSTACGAFSSGTPTVLRAPR